MKRAYLRDAAFLADVRTALHEGGSHLYLWWLGQSGFLVACEGQFLLFDPYLSDSLTVKYAGTDKPHVRMTERVIAPDRLDFIDVVTSSHNHTDHLDGETLTALRQANPGLTVVVPQANVEFAAARLGVSPDELTAIDAGDRLPLPAATLTGVPAAHETIELDPDGHHRHLGYVAHCGPWKVYHSGDTVRYPGMEEVLRPHGIDVALLPINGTSPERRVAGNLNGPEAARLAHDIGARWVIPCHFDMFEFNTASPEAFTAEAERLGQRYRVLRVGEGWSTRGTY